MAASPGHQEGTYEDPLKVDLSSGACVGVDDPGADTDKPGWAAWFAGRYCQHCPVRMPCLEQGIAHNEAGVWGGMTQQQRRDIADQRRTVRALRAREASA